MRNDVAQWLTVFVSLALGLILQLIPLPAAWNTWHAPWLVMLVLFWCLHLPSVAGIGLAWVTGLLLDAASGSPLGSHALIFTLVAAITIAAQRLLLTLSVIQQALWVALLVLFQQIILLLLLPTGLPTYLGAQSLTAYFSPALMALVLWPVLHLVLFSWVHRKALL